MKRTLVLTSVVLLVLLSSTSLWAATLKVGATPVPHAEILNRAIPILAQAGITLEIVEFTDYVRPNLALQDGDLDANFFQHVPIWTPSTRCWHGSSFFSWNPYRTPRVFSQKLASWRNSQQ